MFMPAYCFVNQSNDGPPIVDCECRKETGASETAVSRIVTRLSPIKGAFCGTCVASARMNNIAQVVLHAARAIREEEFMRTSMFSDYWRTTPFASLFLMVAALVFSVSNAAAQVIFENHVPFNFAFDNPCTGEPFTGTGFIHLRSTLQTAPNFHVSVEENFENAKGTTSTGVMYTVPLQSTLHEVADLDFAPDTFSFEETTQFIRQAEDGTFVMGDDFFVQNKVHATVNANGVPTVSAVESTATCK